MGRTEFRVTSWFTASAIRLWVKLENLGNVRAPVDLDVCSFPWPVSHADAVLCLNMIHVAPWAKRCSRERRGC
jgi:hypothetical protein